MTRPNFAVSADETPYRRLAATIREDIYRLIQTSYTFGVQSQSGLINLDQTKLVLEERRNKINGKLESLLMLVDLMAEMKDVNVGTKGETLKPERRSRAKLNTAAIDAAVERIKAEKAAEAEAARVAAEEAEAAMYEDPTVDAEAQALVDRVLSTIEAGA